MSPVTLTYYFTRSLTTSHTHLMYTCLSKRFRRSTRSLSSYNAHTYVNSSKRSGVTNQTTFSYEYPGDDPEGTWDPTTQQYESDVFFATFEHREDGDANRT